jgi:Ser/Thr protein kinase RdoA (MazF antagonist)
MRNIEVICDHLKAKLLAIPGKDPARGALTLVRTASGKTWAEDAGGSAWRMFLFIPDTVTYQQILNPSMAFEAGKAIGDFQKMLIDLPVSLTETIPDFHDLYFRMKQYREALSHDPAGRAASIPSDLEFVEGRLSRIGEYYEHLKQQAVLRVTHNDTKLNNILFDQQGTALCLIDLDTVMPGYIHFDYGDALRTMANTAAEDETDLEKVLYDREVARNFNKGYLESARDFLTAEETRLIDYSPVYLTFLIGLRFLTDYLNGDVYFRVHYPEHNLVRARVQFQLVKEMEQLFH